MLQPAQNFWRLSERTTSPLFRRSDGYYLAGWNNNGQLGTGIVAQNSTTFRKVRFPDGVVIKLLGAAHHVNEGIQYIAVDTDNYFWSWGYNERNGIEEEDSDNYFQPIKFNPLELNR
jgi:hypothetical protein